MGVSIRCVSVVLSVSGVLLAAVIAGLLTLDAGNRALSSTNDACNRGLNLSFTSGDSNSRALAIGLMDAVGDQLLAKLKMYHSVPVQLVESVFGYASALGGGRGNDTLDYTLSHGALRTLVRQYLATSRIYGVTQVSLMMISGGVTGIVNYQIHYEAPETIERPDDAFHSFWGYENLNASVLLMVQAGASGKGLDVHLGSTDELGHIVRGPCNKTAPFVTNGREHSGWCKYNATVGFGLDIWLPRVGSSLNEPLSWSPVEQRGRLLGSSTWKAASVDGLSPMASKGSLIVWAQVDTMRLSGFLAESVKQLPAYSRIYLVERDPWAQHELLVTGVSHGKSYTVLDLGVAVFRNSSNVTNVEDSVIRAHASHVHGQNVSFGTLAGETTVWGHEGRTYWVVAKVLEDKSKGSTYPLRLYCIMLVPQEEAMRTINEATEAVAANIASDRRETDEQRDKDQMVTLAILIPCIVLLAGLSIAFSTVITAPLRELGEQMHEVANMQLDGMNTSKLSTFAEVSSMQEAFHTMHSALVEYRNYMPQTLLDQLANPTTDDDVLSSDSSMNDADNTSSRRSPTDSREPSKLGKMVSEYSLGMNNLSTGVRKKRVTFAAYNLRNFHDQIESDSDMMMHHSNLLAMMLRAFQSTHGVPDTFNGDRILCSYNGVRVCGAQCVNACKGAMQLSRQVEDYGITNQLPFAVSVGVAVGQVMVGNMGCGGMKKFTSLGRVVTFVHALERYCRHLELNILITQAVRREVSSMYYTRLVEKLAIRKCAPYPVVVAELCLAKPLGKNDEWMYQMEEADLNDPWGPWNRCLEAVFADPPQFGVAAEILPCLGEHEDTLGSRVAKWVSNEMYEPVEILYH